MKAVVFVTAVLTASRVTAWQFPPSAQKPLAGFAVDDGGDDDIDILYGSQFSGLNTYARIPYVNCFSDDAAKDTKYDIAILGAPFDTGVTARPGARYGPRGIRTGSQRQYADAAWSVYTGKNALKSWATVVDCGDVPLTYLDNNYALAQLTKGHKVSGRSHEYVNLRGWYPGVALTSVFLLRSSLRGKRLTRVTPRYPGSSCSAVITRRRSLRCGRYGSKSLCYLCASEGMRKEADGNSLPNLDTWDPLVLGGGISDYAGLNHGTFLHIAHEEGLIRNTSIHAGIRGPLARRKGDIRNDERCGFARLTARDIDRFGTSGIVSRIRDRVTGPVYISVDIDVLDPAFAPATGTPEPGGWSTRELLTILDGLSGLEVVGADVVEVAPAYDTRGETTTLAAAQVVWSLLELMVETPATAAVDRAS
ncbi:hypothetical protein GQX73_g9319 [Xylaria multiplex]|uniref:Agmatinase n=1 Tax=Xylaria multiplex TaxID=323545 RepID=A0A7C8IL57_9PEZI|nr:hypothetical protein GQX73_g9319 [Xylaria multiplex]